MPRKKRKVSSYSFLIVPDTKDNPKNFKISSFVLKILILVLIVVVTLIIFGASSYWKVAEMALDYTRLEEENFKLAKSLESVKAMEAELNTMKKMNSKIRETLTGYVQVDKINNEDTTQVDKLDFKELVPEKRRTIFNFIPSEMPVEGFITRGYKVEDLIVDPHYGLDIAASKGTPVKAPADGTIVFSGWTHKSGYVLIIEHKFGYITVFKHNQRNLVSELEKVKKGQAVALLGDSGEISSGAHLHFEIWNNGQPLNPLMYVSGKSKQQN
jgi:murein DD-endopeptidase MepM/ murein hydrolase activator NlpD